MSESRMSFPTIQMLWIEGRLSRLEKLSMASFLANGHPVDLYTYGLENEPPKGVRVLDASRIIPTDRLFKHKGNIGFGSWGTFSDLFRFTLLYEHGGVWCDSDVVCLKPLTFADRMPVFLASEPAVEKLGDGTTRPGALATTCVLCSPPGHRFMEICLEKFHAIDFDNMRWAASGPGVVQDAVKELGLSQQVLHPEIICPVPPWEASSLLFGVRPISPSAYAIHFWNEVLRWNFFNKDESYDRHSIYERLCRHYLHEEHDS